MIKVIWLLRQVNGATVHNCSNTLLCMSPPRGRIQDYKKARRVQALVSIYAKCSRPLVGLELLVGAFKVHVGRGLHEACVGNLLWFYRLLLLLEKIGHEKHLEIEREREREREKNFVYGPVWVHWWIMAFN